MNTDWQFDTTASEAELAILRYRIEALTDFVTKRDLYKMYMVLDVQLQQILREQARCKLVGRQSSNHKNLVTAFNEHRETFIDYMTFGLLSI